MNYPSHDKIEGGRYVFFWPLSHVLKISDSTGADLGSASIYKAVHYWLPAEPAPWLHPVPTVKSGLTVDNIGKVRGGGLHPGEVSVRV